ncbi:Catechol 1,2-dioxygenase [Cladobotryum mycophilum]|uniref:Catechol 1,2-dioxygenase n=1 Tax=Cladobotryum mycophilum TaxID=491253 RepID=A0ABR0SH93_9HYPO
MAPTNLEDLTSENLTPHVIKTCTEHVADERTKELISGLIQHLHDFTREVKLKPIEWETAIRYLTKVGQGSSPERQEFVLLSDVLGLSALVDTLNSAQANVDSATESSTLGPFHNENAHVLDNGQCIGAPGVVGELMLMHGTLRSTDGAPIEGATVDVWETNGNGLYDMQDPSRPDSDCRGVFTTDEKGRFYLLGVKSVDYDIPNDGPVGDLLNLLDRNITRPAHVHFQLKHPSYVNLTTALYDADSEHIANDPVFGTKKSLVKTVNWSADPKALIEEYKLQSALGEMSWDGKGLWVIEHDFVLLKK